MEDLFIVSSSPHYRAKTSTRSVMLDVIIALVPALVVSVVFFGLRALTLVLVSVLSCVLFETLFNRIRKKKNTVSDLSCIVTGILFAFNLPIVAPYWLAVFGAFFAIVVAKMLFGGLGKNFVNPALSARAACLTSWPGLMSVWVAFPAAKTVSAFSEPLFSASDTFDGVTSATPLSSLKGIAERFHSFRYPRDIEPARFSPAGELRVSLPRKQAHGIPRVPGRSAPAIPCATLPLRKDAPPRRPPIFLPPRFVFFRKRPNVTVFAFTIMV